MRQIYSQENNLLFCPGPVNIEQNIWEAVSKNIGHREIEFSTLLSRINDKLLKLYEIKNVERYHPVVITGSGTAANETVLSSIVGKKTILVLTNGEFGERLFKISSLHNKNTRALTFDWGEEIDVAKVEEYLSKNKVDIIAMVHHETSTGMLNPVSRIGKLVGKYNLQFFVDTVSSAPIEKIDLEKWHVTFCSTSSGKAIGAPPGLGIVIGEVEAYEKLKDIPAKITYLNLYTFYHYSKHLSQTPNTPAVHLFYALDQALTNILVVGLDTIRFRTIKRAEIMREGMEELGLKFILNKKQMSSVLTTILVPTYTTADEIKERLKEKNIVIYTGKGPLIGQVFQVGNIGNFNHKQIQYFLKSLKETLRGSEEIEVDKLFHARLTYNTHQTSKSTKLVV